MSASLIPSEPLPNRPISSQRTGSTSQRVSPVNGYPATSEKSRQENASPKSSHDAMPDATSREPGFHRRTGSSFRNVMRKVFSRRRTRTFDNKGESPSARSDREIPGAIDEGTPLFAVTHPTGGSSDHDHAPDSTESLKNRENAPVSAIPRPRRQRRATIPSLLMYDDSDPNRTGGSAVNGNNSTDELQQRNDLQAKRRSRSVTTLTGIAKYHDASPNQWQRCSVGVNHTCWKPSNLETASVSESSVGPDTMTTANERNPSLPSTSDVEARHGTEKDYVKFNAGDLFNSMQHGGEVTLEQRLSTVEVKLIDFELAIARMQENSTKPVSVSTPRSNPGLLPWQHTKNQPFGTPPPPVGKASYGRLQNDESSLGSVSTIQPPTHPNPNGPTQEQSVSLHDANPILVEQNSVLNFLLKRECSARKDLETQIASLQHEVRQLQEVVGASTNVGVVGTRYPIQSMHSEDYLRLQHSASQPEKSAPMGSQAGRVGMQPIYDSDSGLDYFSRGDGFVSSHHRPFHDSRHIEITGMI